MPRVISISLSEEAEKAIEKLQYLLPGYSKRSSVVNQALLEMLERETSKTRKGE